MGVDKASLAIGGLPMAARIAGQLQQVVERVTVLGRVPLEGCAFQMDEEPGAGPQFALRRFTPVADHVFVVSCDIPLFESSVVMALHERIGSFQAAVPMVDGRLQPTCALYTRAAFDILKGMCPTERSMMSWLQLLELSAIEPVSLGFDPKLVTGCNTPKELDALLQRGH